MPLIEGGISAQTIEIAIAFNILNPNTISFAQYNIQGFIVMRAVLVFKFDKITEFNLFSFQERV